MPSAVTVNVRVRTPRRWWLIRLGLWLRIVQPIWAIDWLLDHIQYRCNNEPWRNLNGRCS